MRKTGSVLLYRCRWCEVTFQKGSVEHPNSAVTDALTEQKVAKVMAIHRCDGVRQGVGDLIGARPMFDYEQGIYDTGGNKP